MPKITFNLLDRAVLIICSISTTIVAQRLYPHEWPSIRAKATAHTFAAGEASNVYFYAPKDSIIVALGDGRQLIISRDEIERRAK